MRGLIVFDSLNDLVFLKVDDEFNLHLARIAEKNQLITPHDESNGNQSSPEHGSHIDRDVVMQLFSPLITSNRIMQGQFGNGYNSVECTNGMFLVMREYLSYCVIGVGNLNKDTAAFIQRRLEIFIEFLKLLYGPSLQVLRQESADSSKRPRLLSTLIDTWDYLRSTEQAFLVEAVERLLVNQTISKVVMKLLQNSLGRIRGFASAHNFDESPCHTLLLVKNKLLGLYSCRNTVELSKEDLLLLVLLARAVHANDADHIEQHLTCREDGEGCQNDGVELTSAENKATESHDNFQPLLSSDEDISLGTEATESIDSTDSEEKLPHFQQHHLFLRPKGELLEPCYVYTVKISSQLILMVVSQVKKNNLCSALNTCVGQFSRLITRPREHRCHHASEALENNMYGIFDQARRLHLSAEEERHLKLVLSKWEQLKKLGILEFIKSSDLHIMDSSLEAVVTSMQETLSEAFSALFLKQSKHMLMLEDPLFLKLLCVIQSKAIEKLSFCMEYLFVKAQGNISIASYLHEYPGLVYFIYVERTSNFLLASTLGHHPELKEEQLLSLKKKIWQMMEFIQEKVILEGCLDFTRREDVFHFSYHLFFEDPLVRSTNISIMVRMLNLRRRKLCLIFGNILKGMHTSCFNERCNDTEIARFFFLQGKKLEPNSAVSSRSKFTFPGIIGGDFYRSLVKKHFPHTSPDHVQCFEIFCVHLSASCSTATIRQQTWKLGMMLWESCNSAQAAVDIL